MKWEYIFMIIQFAFIAGLQFFHERTESELESTIKKQQKRSESQNTKINEYADTIDKLSRQILNQHETIIWLSENRQREE